jgi:hypothetical protein
MIARRRRGLLGRLAARLHGIRDWVRSACPFSRQTSSQELRVLPGARPVTQVPFPRLGPATTFWWAISLELRKAVCAGGRSRNAAVSASRPAQIRETLHVEMPLSAPRSRRALSAPRSPTVLVVSH